jgi:hypothetical protein
MSSSCTASRPRTETEAETRFRVDVERGRAVDLPRMSKHLRGLLESIGAALWERQFDAPGPETLLRVDAPLTVPEAALSIEKERSKLSIFWADNEAGTEVDAKETYTKSELQGLLRSLLSNEAGSIRVWGFGGVSWNRSGEEVRQVAQENGIIEPARGKTDVFKIRRDAIRSAWSDGAYPLLTGVDDATICLNARGRRLIADLQAWKRAKKVGVDLEQALCNENLPSSYLSPSQRRDPGRYRSRSLYKCEVEGAQYYGTKSLIARGTPPELEDKHQEASAPLQKGLRNAHVQAGTLFGRAAPKIYLEREDPTYRRIRQYIGLENGMLVTVREGLYLREAFPEGTWTTAFVEFTTNKTLGDDQTHRGTYPVVVDEDESILGMVAPPEKESWGRTPR